MNENRHLIQDKILRDNYFIRHRNEADEFYRRHSEFVGERNGPHDGGGFMHFRLYFRFET